MAEECEGNENCCRCELFDCYYNDTNPTIIGYNFNAEMDIME